MNTERLLKLADHLEHGKLGHEIFDFTTFNSGCRPECGSSGCAIGECPILFPAEWRWTEEGMPQLNSITEFRSVWHSVQEFFDLKQSEAFHLFAYDCQMPDLFGGEILGVPVIPRQVASNIRAFISKMQGVSA